MMCLFYFKGRRLFLIGDMSHIIYLGAEKIAPVFIQSTHMLVRDPFCMQKCVLHTLTQNFVLGSCSRIRIQCIS